MSLAGALLGVAQASGESVVVSYQAPDGCPGRGDFLAELRARTARADVVEAAGRRFEVSIARGEGEFAGRVVVRGGEGASTERTFTDETCSEVASALALVVALAIDPEASTAPLAPASSAPVASAAPARVTPPLASSPVASASAAPVASVAPVHVDVPYEPRGWRPAVGVQASGIVGPGPRTLFGGAVFGEIGSTSGRTLSLSVRLGLIATVVAPTERTGDRASAKLVAGRVDGCAIRLRAEGVGRLDLCATAEAGGLRGEGLDVAQATGSWRSWVALGALARARHTTRGGFFVEAELGLLAPLTHDPLVLTGPRETVYTPPRVVVPFAIGVGLDFL